jgi:hypothetical protein
VERHVSVDRSRGRQSLRYRNWDQQWSRKKIRINKGFLNKGRVERLRRREDGVVIKAREIRRRVRFEREEEEEEEGRGEIRWMLPCQVEGDR